MYFQNLFLFISPFRNDFPISITSRIFPCLENMMTIWRTCSNSPIMSSFTKKGSRPDLRRLDWHTLKCFARRCISLQVSSGMSPTPLRSIVFMLFSTDERPGFWCMFQSWALVKHLYFRITIRVRSSSPCLVLSRHFPAVWSLSDTSSSSEPCIVNLIRDYKTCITWNDIKCHGIFSSAKIKKQSIVSKASTDFWMPFQHLSLSSIFCFTFLMFTFLAAGNSESLTEEVMFDPESTTLPSITHLAYMGVTPIVATAQVKTI